MDALYATQLWFIAEVEATKKAQDVGGTPIIVVFEYNGEWVEDPEYPFEALFPDPEDAEMEPQPVCFKIKSVPRKQIKAIVPNEPVYYG
ncbi:hypothetical protein D3C81_1540840 [compost metagenome]